MPRKLGLLPLVATIFCCVSGGPFGLEPVMASGAGMGLLLIVVAPIIWALPAALMTAELASAMPEEGGYYVWVKTAVGPFAGFLCGWWSWVYSWVDAAVYPALFASYLISLCSEFGLHSGIDANAWLKWTVGLVLIAPMTWMNLRGIRMVGAAASAFMVFLIVPFAAMAVLGFSHAVGHPPGGFLAPGKTASQAFGAGLFVVMWNYLGWDSLSTVAGEVERPQRSFPRALAIAVPLVTLSYLVPAYIGITWMRDPSKWDTGAWTLVAHAMGGTWLAVAMGVAGIIGVGGMFATTLLAASRVPLVLASDGYLPASLSRVHPRYGTPVMAILVSAVIYTALSYQGFKALAALDVVVYSAGLTLELLALVVLRVRRPDMARPYKIPGGWPVVALVGLLPCGLILFGIYSQFHDPDGGGSKFLLLSAVALVSGPIVYALQGKRGAVRVRSDNVY